jgi:hypothetical protein
MDGTGPENRPECFHEQALTSSQRKDRPMYDQPQATICREHLSSVGCRTHNTALAYLSQNGTTLAQEQPASLM